VLLSFQDFGALGPSTNNFCAVLILHLSPSVGAQSAESAIGFGRRLQHREIAGLRNMWSCSIPTAPTNSARILRQKAVFARGLLLHP